MKDFVMDQAYQLGTYRQLSLMMRECIRDQHSATDEFDREWATKRLLMLAEQFDEAVKKFEKEVDTA